MDVDQQTCPVCERRRDDHAPECRYEGTLLAQHERLREACRHLGRAVAADWPLFLLIASALWGVVFAVDRLLLH